MNETQDSYPRLMRMRNSHENEDDLVLDAIARVLAQGAVAVISGAGMSTDSGIPDYRGLGSRQRKTITIDDFLNSQLARSQYWLRAHQGWSRFANAQPNKGHMTLADFEQAGLLTGLVTQNVDGLHRLAGSKLVVELHGWLGNVVCVACGQQFSRPEVHQVLQATNPWLRDLPASFDIDEENSDALAEYASNLETPRCSVCLGTLKPDVVFFGESVPTRTYAAARETIARSKAVVVLGSSLAVNSAVRLVHVARRSRTPIYIVNRGATHLDHAATGILNRGVSEVLSELAWRLDIEALVEDIE